jgi:hypothetical protein
VQFVCERFPDIVAQASSGGREDDDWLRGGLNISCAYRVRAVNSFGVGKYSQANKVLLGGVFISRSEIVERGFYRPSHDQHAVIQHALSQLQLQQQQISRLQTPNKRLNTAQSTQSNVSEARDFFEFSEESHHPLTGFLTYEPTTSEEGRGEFGVGLAESVEELVGEDDEWLRELSMACPIK